MVQELTLKWISCKSLFVNIPMEQSRSLVLSNGIAVLELLTEQGTVYVGWSGLVSPLNTIEMDRRFGLGLGLTEGSVSVVSIGANSPRMVFVEPVSFADWEILELNAGYLESLLLNQVKVVYIGQTLTIWIHSNVVQVKVERMEPEGHVGVLSHDVEVVVTPKPRSIEPVQNLESVEKPGLYRIAHSTDLVSCINEPWFAILPSLDNNCEKVTLKYLDPLSKDTRETHLKVYLNERVPLGHIVLSPKVSAFLEAKVHSRVTVRPYSGTIEIPETINESIVPQEIDCEKSVFYNLLSDLTESLSSFQLSSKLTNNPSKNGILLAGSNGSGKSTLLKYLASVMKSEQIHPVVVDCANWQNKSIEDLKLELEDLTTEAFWYQPSMLLLDDLDKCVPTETEGRDSSRSNWMSGLLLSWFHQLFQGSVTLLATVSDKSGLHGSISLEGLFNTLFEIPCPDLESRVKGVPCKVNWESWARKMDGFVMADIEQATQCVVQLALLNNEVTDQDVEKAMSEFRPSSLHSLKLHSSSVSWDDIGGLVETKKILLETLQLPSQYPAIFSQSPLRLRQGILLYGYSGCAKTLLASAVAAQCGLNFISVKGPELLNKYIGASEKSVRDLFARARSARPCCLFFDEFDSIAPRRGQDHTGVTDRIVNQLLTEMDGAEGLEGVFVLGATSRPDMIDPALLRPGRLDKSLFCDLPTLEDRLDILRAVGRKMNVDDELLVGLSSQTNGFTGADLQGLLYSAQLEAIQESLSVTEESVQESVGLQLDDLLISGPIEPAERLELDRQLDAWRIPCEKKSAKQTTVTIQSRHVDSALACTRPSLSIEERSRLARVFEAFRSGVSLEVGQRVSLA